MLTVILLSVFTTFLITSGQVLWKIGLQQSGGFYMADQSLINNLFRILTNGWVFSGFVVYLIATGFFMYLLSKYDISLVIPISSVSFIFSLIAGALIFHEHISAMRLVGVLVIIAGIFMVLRS